MSDFLAHIGCQHYVLVTDVCARSMRVYGLTYIPTKIVIIDTNHFLIKSDKEDCTRKNDGGSTN